MSTRSASTRSAARRRTASDAAAAAATAFPYVARLRVSPLLMCPLEGGPCRVFVTEVPFKTSAAEAHRFGALAFSAMVDRHWEEPGAHIVLAFVLHAESVVSCSVLCGAGSVGDAASDIPPHLASTAATCEMVATLLVRADHDRERRVYVIGAGAAEKGGSCYTVSQCKSVLRLAKLSLFFRSVAPD